MLKYELLYADKEKIQTDIDQQRINLAEVAYLDLDSIANIVKVERKNKLFQVHFAECKVRYTLHIYMKGDRIYRRNKIFNYENWTVTYMLMLVIKFKLYRVAPYILQI